MSKSEFIDRLAAKAGLTKKDAKAFLNAYQGVLEDALSHGEKVQLIGFGTYEVKERAERKGRNPQTGEVISIPATKTVRFKVGAGLKAAVK